MRILAFFFAFLGLVACSAPTDETISGYTLPQDVWYLQTINDRAVNAQVTIAFPKIGQVYGNAPCNSYSARQSAPLPWFQISGIAATRRACANLRLEQQYFNALRSVNMAEVLGDTLLLTGPSMKLVFLRNDP